MNPLTSFLVFVFIAAALAAGYFVNLYVAIAFFAVAVLIASSLKMANVWQKFVILRIGKLQSVRGAGLFAIIPVLDTVIAIIDERIQTTAFNAEQALTKDTVPVNVDAIIFWHVHDAEKAALAITNYREAIDRVAQTSLREMIGSSMLAALLSDRKQADEQLKDRDRSEDRSVGYFGELGGDPRCRHSGGPAGCDVPPGAGRAREAGAGDSRFGGSRDRGHLCRRGGHLRWAPHGAATSSDEHHLRDHQGKRGDDTHAELDGRQPEPPVRGDAGARAGGK